MSAAKDARNLTLIRKAIRTSTTRATLATVQRDTGLSVGVIQKMVKLHHLRVSWRARETLERLSNEYTDAMLDFHNYCEKREMNFRSAVIGALAAFKRRHR